MADTPTPLDLWRQADGDGERYRELMREHGYLARRPPRQPRVPNARVPLAAAYVGTVVAANWAVTQFGMVPVWPIPVLLAPAGVWFAGLAFTLRDLLHEAAGKRWPWWIGASIAVGALVSAWVATPALALASGAAFAVSELADTAVYAPLRQRRWLLAVVLSNLVGLVVDSALFLWLAFGSLEFLPGQVVGKAWMTAAAVLVRVVVRWRRQPRLAVAM